MQNNTQSYILAISNWSPSRYEMPNIVGRREKFYIINSIDLDTIVDKINEKYLSKEGTSIIVKIININNDDQLTLEYIVDSLNLGFYIKKSK